MRPIERSLGRLVAVVLLVGFAACAQPPVEGPGKAKNSSGGKKEDAGVGGTLDFGLAPVRPTDGPACTPIKCSLGPYCGEIGDGCGNRLTCPDACPDGLTCGGGGVAKVCGRPVDPNCKPLGCKQPGGQFCGRVGDGCGHALECGIL